MHYTGMGASYVFPGASLHPVSVGLDPTFLGAWVSVATVLITGLAIFVTVVDSRLEAAAQSGASESVPAARSHREYFGGVLPLRPGRSTRALQPAISRARRRRGADRLVGMRFEEVMRLVAERGRVADARGRVDEWVAERVARHRTPRGPYVQELAGGRWLQVSERKIEEIGTVAVYTDITGPEGGRGRDGGGHARRE
jgi:hypothetical protein